MIYFNVLGCCVSRDIVNPLISKGKAQVLQFITCNPYCIFWPSPQHKIEIDVLNGYTVPNHLKRIFVKDYNKETLNYLFLRRSDYLIVDIMNFRLDMLKNDNHIITFFDFLEHNREKFNKDFCMDKYEKVSPYEINESEQFAALDKLADEILKRYTPNQIILPLFDGVEQYLNHNENVIKDFAKSEIENTRKYNLFMANLKEHFVTKLGGGHIIEFPNQVLADQQHVFGLHELHYMKLYYEYAADCINVIIQRFTYEDEKQKLLILKESCSEKFELLRNRVKVPTMRNFGE